AILQRLHRPPPARHAGTFVALVSRKCPCPAYHGALNSWRPMSARSQGNQHQSAPSAPFPARCAPWPSAISLVLRFGRPSTQYTYRNVIDRLCIEHGDKRVALLQREHVIKLLAARAHTPGIANAMRRSLRALMLHAVEIGMRADDPTRDVRKVP